MKNTLYIVAALILISGCASTAKKQISPTPPAPVSDAYDLSSPSSMNDTDMTAIETSTAQVSLKREPLSLSKKEIQTILKKTGFYSGPIDGIFGPQSRKAIKAFQKAKGLQVDGLCGMKTRELMLPYLD